MQQTLDSRSWYERSRLKGALRFHVLKLGTIILWILGILLAVQLLNIVLTLAGMGNYEANGVSAEFGTAMAVLSVFACMLSKSSATFLFRFGTPRTSVWLSGLIALFVSGAAFLVGSLVLSILTNFGVLALSGLSGAFTVISGETSGIQAIMITLKGALRELPMLLLWTLEWSCLFYLLGCCLRRNMAVTLTVCILVPLLFWVMLFVPMVREAVDLMESGTQAEIVLTGMQWLQWLTNAFDFFAQNWQWVQGLAALISLPLSWLCMRSTPQP